MVASAATEEQEEMGVREELCKAIAVLKLEKVVLVVQVALEGSVEKEAMERMESAKTCISEPATPLRRNKTPLTYKVNRKFK
ncbi:MAG: hypothetical protein EB023_04845 [Flavobacteriia bacterium]|nr:hypothetical protein [Flavobacteriia bacterium]